MLPQKPPSLSSHLDSIRPRIHREFFTWQHQSKHRFAIGLRIVRRTDRWLQMAFVGINPAIVATLSRTGTSVSVEVPGDCWDLIFDMDAVPEHTHQGYVCAFCPADAREVYASRAALWRNHLFEPFLQWISTRLNSSELLLLFGDSAGCISASLVAVKASTAERDVPSMMLVVHDGSARRLSLQ